MDIKLVLASAACIIMSATTVKAQTGTIAGTISGTDSVTVIPGVSVYLEGTQLGAATNGNGRYVIQNVPAGNHSLIISSIGYQKKKVDVRVTDGETITVDRSLGESISNLSEVIVMTGGTRGLKDISGSASYISPKEIQRFNYTDINRTLRTVAGINIQEEDGFGLRPNIGLRGTGVERSSKITVMEDGVLIAPAPYTAPAAYYFPTIGRMQAIEILKGSSQIKYGPYTTGGAINLVSTQIPEEFSGRINLMLGSFLTRSLHAYVGNSHKNFAYLVETFQHGSNGFKQLDGGGNTGFNKQDYLVKLRVNTNEGAPVYQSLTFKMGYVTENSNETYLGLTRADFDADPYRRYAASQMDEMNTEHLQLSLSHVMRFSKLVEVTTTGYRNTLGRNWYKLDKVSDSTGTATSIGALLDDPLLYDDAYAILTGQTSATDDALSVKANNRKYYGQGVQTVITFNFNTGSVKHKVDVGFRYHQDQMDRFQWVDQYAMLDGRMGLTTAGIPGTESNRIESAEAIASYVQYRLKVGRFTATPGLRYEFIKLNRIDYGKTDPQRTGSALVKRGNEANVFIPGIGLDYRFTDFLSSFAGVHRGFAPPGSTAGVKPEMSINYELGVRYAKNTLSAEAVVFFNDYSNLLGSDLAASGGSGTTDMFNGGEVRTVGLELQASYDILSFRKNSSFRMPISLTYTFTDAQFENSFESEYEGWGNVSAGDDFPYLARSQFSFVIALEHRKFSLNLSGRYTDSMRTLPGQGEMDPDKRTDAYFIIDASAAYHVHNNISLFGSATNLTNKVYMVATRPAGLRPGMPMAFNIGVKTAF